MLTLTEETCLHVHLRQAPRQLQDQLSHYQAPSQLQEQLSHHCATQQRQHQIQLLSRRKSQPSYTKIQPLLVISTMSAQ